MKTGMEAVRFGIVLYTLPYLFVYSPALLFQGTLPATAYIFAKALMGVFALAVGAQGYFLRPLNWLQRALFVAASILVFWPTYLFTGLGVALLTVLVIIEVSSRKAAALPGAAS